MQEQNGEWCSLLWTICAPWQSTVVLCVRAADFAIEEAAELGATTKATITGLIGSPLLFAQWCLRVHSEWQCSSMMQRMPRTVTRLCTVASAHTAAPDPHTPTLHRRTCRRDGRGNWNTLKTHTQQL